MDFILQVLGIIFWFVVILVPLVAVHEFGHLLISRAFKVKIPEYGIGLPLVRRTFYRRWKGIIWSFYWPLLGGFVRIFGDNDAIDEAWETAKTDPKKSRQDYLENRFQEIVGSRELQFFLEDNSLVYDESWKKFEYSKFAKGEQVETEKESYKDFENKLSQTKTLIDWEYDKYIDSKETFYSKNWIQQTLIISGGVLFNTISAVAIFWFLFSVVSVNNTYYPVDDFQKLEKNAQITSKSDFVTAAIIKGSKAEEVGLKSGDEIVSFAGVKAQEIDSQEEFRQLVQDNKDTEVIVEYRQRGQDELIKKTVRIEEKDGKVVFGIGPLLREIDYRAKNPFSGVTMAVERTASTTSQTFQLLGSIALAPFPGQDKQVLDYVGGPIAVGSVSSKVFELAGVAGILEVMATVSISLAVFNTLPIPALDGGRWVILTINKILGKRNRKLEAAAISITFLLMIGLAILIAFRDVQGIIVGRF